MKFRRSMLLVVFCGCSTNDSGHVATTKVGDTSHPAERRSPIDGVRAACGDGGVTGLGSASITRTPYLQQVTSTSAQIGWVTTDVAEQRVHHTRAGAAIDDASAIAMADDVPTSSGSEQQMWTSLDGLGAGSIECYSISGRNGELFERTGFRTAPSRDSVEPVRILAFGDSGGGGADQYALLDQMYTVPFDMMIHVGDLAYEGGTMAQFEERVFDVYADLFRNIPFFPSPGNHEYGTANAVPYRAVFSIPGDSNERWYSYDWGRVHFAALDTEADYATQVAWLDKDLAASALPWKIVYMHRPPYSSGHHGSDVSLRNKLAPVLKRHGVQLVLAGHDHNYERMKPQDGVNYVVTGGGGRGTRPVGSSSFTAFSEDVIHFSYIEVGVDEAILHAIDANGTEFDSLVIPRVVL